MRKYTFLLSILVINILLLSGCIATSPDSKESPAAVKGILDLTGWDFEKDGTINLTGEWSFYWMRFLEWSDVQKGDLTEGSSYIHVPSSWNKFEINGNKLSGNGYATYVLMVKLKNSDDTILGLKIPRMFTAYSLWSDDKLIASNGKVALTGEEMVSQYHPQIVTLRPKGNMLHLIVHVSNFSHRSGGMLESIKLGTEDQIINLRENKLALELFLFGSLIIISIYHIVLYLFRRKNASPLFFGIYCLLIAIRTLFVGEIFFIQLFPRFNWEIQHKIQTLSFYIGVPVFVMFIYSIYPNEFPRKILRVIQAAGIIFSLLVITTPARIFTVFNPAYQIVTVVMALFCVHTFILACIRKRSGAGLITVGGILLVLTAINDLLFLSVPFNDNNIPILRNIIVTGNLSSCGLIAFVFSQSIVLAMNTSKAFLQVEELSDELIIADKQKDELLSSLEDKVKERTLELEKSNNQLKKAYDSHTRLHRGYS